MIEILSFEFEFEFEFYIFIKTLDLSMYYQKGSCHKWGLEGL